MKATGVRPGVGHVDARQVLECQDCGEVIQHLTPEETREVAARPYDFVRYCRICSKFAARRGARDYG